VSRRRRASPDAPAASPPEPSQPSAPTPLSIGNAGTDGVAFGHWIVGDFRRWAADRGVASPDVGLRETTAVAIKWGVHAAGERRPGGWAAPDGVVTLSVLVSGEFVLSFREHTSAELREVRLTRPGDYVVWGWDRAHTWRAERDSVVLSVRWPAPVTSAGPDGTIPPRGSAAVVAPPEDESS
jgi:hypothetical protein